MSASALPIIDLTSNQKQRQYFIEVVKAINGITDYRYFGYGGAIRGGKTFVTLGILVYLCNRFPGSKWHCIRSDFPALIKTTIPSLEKILQNSPNWRWNRDKSNYYAVNAEGSKIFFMAENIQRDPELNTFLGLETNGFFLEQAEELTEKLWDIATSRCGSWYIDPMPPAFMFTTFNPTQEWPKKKFYTPFVKGELKTPYYFQTALPKDNPFVTRDQWNAWSNMADRYQKQFIEGDWTDFGNNNSRWAFAFDRNKHIGKCIVNYDYPIWLSFDFNKNPISCSIIQHYNDTIFIPKCIKLPNSNIYDLCDMIWAIYGVNNPLFLITGDATGRASNALVKDNRNYYTIIKQKFNLTPGQMKQPSFNPKLEENQVLVNSLLSNYQWCIDEDEAAALIYDFENVKMLPDGTIDKGDRTDAAKQADALDTARYFCNTELSWFIKIFT